MTLVVVLMIGAGVILIASALDNTPIVATFQAIASGQAVDWTGSKATGTAGTAAGAAAGAVLPSQVF